MVYSQTKPRPTLIDINHTTAKAILTILNSKLPSCLKKHIEMETVHQGSMNKSSINSTISDVLQRHSSSSFLFVAVKEFEQNDSVSQKKALVSLSRSCVSYFKPNVFDTSNGKPILQNLFLFDNLEGEDQHKKVLLVMNSFQKSFQNSLLDRIDVFQGWYESFVFHFHSFYLVVL